MFGNYGIMNKEEKTRILAKCDGDIFGDECVMWTGSHKSSKMKGGQHGHFKFRGRVVLAHRLLFHNFVEPLSVEKPSILHSCDTDGRCVCLKHLRAGTAKENAADRDAEGNGRAKLTRENVRDIRKRYREGETQSAIAKSYIVNASNISAIVRRKTWIDVE